jgi:hypothetical protein
MLAERKVNVPDFSTNEGTSSEESGETSKPKLQFNTLQPVKTLRINERPCGSPIPVRRNHQMQIFKSKSGQSLKDFQKRQET